VCAPRATHCVRAVDSDCESGARTLAPIAARRRRDLCCLPAECASPKPHCRDDSAPAAGAMAAGQPAMPAASRGDSALSQCAAHVHLHKPAAGAEKLSPTAAADTERRVAQTPTRRGVIAHSLSKPDITGRLRQPRCTGSRSTACAQCVCECLLLALHGSATR
jgi:hypothetical protein